MNQKEEELNLKRSFNNKEKIINIMIQVLYICIYI